MHDGTSFDKILPKQVGYFGTKITLIENREFGHNARSTTSWFSFPDVRMSEGTVIIWHPYMEQRDVIVTLRQQCNDDMELWELNLPCTLIIICSVSLPALLDAEQM
jgi:hypothetical protein